jgi:hypothetical protein
VVPGNLVYAPYFISGVSPCLTPYHPFLLRKGIH